MTGEWQPIETAVRFWAWLDAFLADPVADPDPYAEHFGDFPHIGGRK